MAVVITINERINLGSKQAVIFTAVATTSTNTVTAATLGLSNILFLSGGLGAGLLTWSGAARATTGSLVQYEGVTASSGTVVGMALGY
jgi:hypothetical protein